MKKILLAYLGVALLAFSSTAEAANAGGKKLPGTITHNIMAKYPDARIGTWMIRNDHYVVKIEEQNDKCTLWYTRDGNWVQTEKHFALTKDLPDAVRQGLDKSKYAGWHIDNMKQLSTPDGQTKYVIHVDNAGKYGSSGVNAGRRDYLVWFSPDGTLIDQSIYVPTR